MNQTLTISNESWPVGVRFDAIADRRAHQLFVRNDQGTRVLAESLEGHDHEIWPCSPVLQQVDQCELGDRRQGVVGVGLGGTSHWSIAIECVPGQGLVFDVACRVNTQPRFLGSTYRTQYPCELVHDSYLELIADESRIGFEVLDGSFHSPPIDGMLTVVAKPFSGSWPATIRWRYQVSVVEP